MPPFHRIKFFCQMVSAKFWEQLFCSERTAIKSFLMAAFLAAVAFLLNLLLFNLANQYFSVVSIFATVLITLYSGVFWGVVLTVLLSLSTDYFFIPPIGSVFDNQQSFEHFVIIVGLGFIMSLFNASLRISFRRTLLAKQELEKALQARDEMIGVISHELKNPLTALQMGIALIQKQLGPEPGNDSTRRLVARLMPSARRMNQLISDLLDITRLEASALKLEPRGCDLLTLVQEVVKTHEAVAEEKLVQLKSTIPPDCQFVYCDPDRTVQILTNLVNNAIKFTNAGGSVSIFAARKGQNIEIGVADTGKGISRDHLPFIFDRFWQVKETAYNGTGLGLSIVKGLVEAQGGSVSVSSEVGCGSTFYFQLPMAAERVRGIRERSVS